MAKKPTTPSAANTRAVTDAPTGEVVASVTDPLPEPERTIHEPRPVVAVDTPAGADVGQAQVQAATEAAEAQGYFGVTPDPTPDAAYTVGGVLSGAPTPETDPAAAAQARGFSGLRNPPRETS